MIKNINLRYIKCDECKITYTFLRKVFYFNEDDSLSDIDEVLNAGEWFSSTSNGVHRSFCTDCAKCDRCGDHAWEIYKNEFLCEEHNEIIGAAGEY